MKRSTIRLNMEFKDRIPVDLISGFRGAGKTTLIRAMTDMWQEDRVVFLQNEQGKESFPGFEGNETFAVVPLTGGCLCCTANSQLEQTLLERKENFSPTRIVLELAETARLSDVKANFAQFPDYRIEHIIYVLNACDFQKKWHLSKRFLEQQFAETPVLYINRIDQTADSVPEAIYAAIAANNPKCKIYEDGANLEELYHTSRTFKQITITGKQQGARSAARPPLITF